MIRLGENIRSKRGGGSYTVIGSINCPRESCQKEIELREQQEPSNAFRKKGFYWSEWSICPYCGLYDNSSGKKVWNMREEENELR